MGLADQEEMIQQHDTLTAAAASYAARAHEGQYRTGTRFPYITHPIGVANLLREHYPSDLPLEAAGYLHDVVEDTPVKIDEIERRFGPDVADLVWAVTSNPGWTLATYADQPRVLRLKAADTLDNVRDTLRGLEKGHDVWSRFTAKRNKARTWRKHADLILAGLPGEPLAKLLDEAVQRAEVLAEKLDNGNGA